MKSWSNHLAVWVLLGSLVALGFTPRAQADDPLEKVRQTINSVLDVAANKDLLKQERAAKIRQVVLQRFSFGEMAKRALGRHWRDRTPQERREFVQLFTDLLENAYVDKIEQSEGKNNVQYTKESIEDDVASVDTEIVQDPGPNIPVTYRLLQRDGDWQVYDIIIDRVSLVSNYRTQFNNIIVQDSYAALVKKMKLKSKQIQAVTNTSSS